MKVLLKFVMVTLVVGLPALLAGASIFSPSAEITPEPGQMPYFMFLFLVESLFLGFGVAFIIFGYPLARKSGMKGSRATFAAIAWLLVSWWAHDNAHVSNGVDTHGILVIDYAFHLTLILSGLVIAYYFLQNAGHGKA